MDFALERHRMVQVHLRGRGIADERVLALMEQLPRHLFVTQRQQKKAYEDEPLPIGMGQTISQPYIVARMTELLGLTGTETVLEVGTGSGYQAAILGRLAARVWTIERHPELAEQAGAVLSALGSDNVHVVVGDGTLGLQEHAPYDAIIVTAAGPSVPPALREQLVAGGRMVIPIAASYGRDLLLVEKLPAAEAATGATTEPPRGPERGSEAAAPPSHFRETTVLACVFVPLIGEQGYPG